MRTPSSHLRKQLESLQLCSANQLQSCSKQVGRLCDELPDFDSVWLDVLVQRRILTRFQADFLQENRADELQVGQLVLRDRLGSRTWTAMLPPDSANTNASGVRRQVVLQRLAHSSGTSLGQVERTVSQLHGDRRAAPSAINVPIRLVHPEEYDTSNQGAPVFLASPYCVGWNLAELLVRGGRLPWQTVLTIGHEVLSAIVWLQSKGCSHGSIHTNNIRITTDGNVTLVGALSGSLGNDGIGLSEQLTFEDVRFLAPERVSNLQPAGFQGDVYSLGCVLWNLLAARDPFLSTDPVRRITSAGQQNLPDLRTIVPDCPVELNSVIQRFTRPNPQMRPTSPTEASSLLNSVGKCQSNQIRTLVKTLPAKNHAAASVDLAKSGASFLKTVSVVTLMICAFVVYGIGRGLIPSVASLTAPHAVANHSQVASTTETFPGTGHHQNELNESGDRILPLPQPDLAGVVVLQSGRQYFASDLKFPGVVHIETTGEATATVIVQPHRAWHLNARQIAISKVHVVQSQPANQPTELLDRASQQAAPKNSTVIRVVADVLSLQQCLVEAVIPDHSSSCIHWTVSSGTTAAFRAENCVLRSNGSAISTPVVPQRFELLNCLLLVKRCGLRATLPDRNRASEMAAWPVKIHRVTQPTGLTFADFVQTNRGAQPCRVTVTAGESVLAPTLALTQFAAADVQTALSSHVEFQLPARGNSVIVPPDVRPAVAWDQSLRATVALADVNVLADSVLPAEPIFAGPAATGMMSRPRSWNAYQLIDYEGPKLTNKMPGIDALRLPKIGASIDTPPDVSPTDVLPNSSPSVGIND